MSDNSQKTPYALSINRFAAAKALSAIRALGRALPCTVVAVNGAIVTVSFEINSEFTLPNVTMPRAGSEWAREPTQVGDTGVAFPANTYLGGVSGLGGGVADLSLQGNLSTLTFFPIGKTSFFAVDPNAYVIYGPNGVVLRTKDGSISLTLNPSGVAVIGDFTIDGDLAVTGNITATGGITAGFGGADSVTLQHHVHPSNGAPPTPGT